MGNPLNGWLIVTGTGNRRRLMSERKASAMMNINFGIETDNVRRRSESLMDWFQGCSHPRTSFPIKLPVSRIVDGESITETELPSCPWSEAATLTTTGARCVLPGNRVKWPRPCALRNHAGHCRCRGRETVRSTSYSASRQMLHQALHRTTNEREDIGTRAPPDAS